MTTRPELRGSFGMVASTHYLATAAGMAVLEAGGNAFDAAVATGFALQVVEPHLNGPGGDMTLLFADPGGAPAGVVRAGPGTGCGDHRPLHGSGPRTHPGSRLSGRGHPGLDGQLVDPVARSRHQVAGRGVAVRDHYAEGGIPVLPSIHRTIAGVAQLFRDDWSTSAAVYLPDGSVPPIGERAAQSRSGAHLSTAAGRGLGAERTGGATRFGPACLVTGFRGARPSRRSLPSPDSTRRGVRHAARADRGRHGRPGRRPTKRRLGDIRRLDRVQVRRLGPGTGAAATTSTARTAGRRSGRGRSRSGRPGAPRRRGGQARLCRPRGLVRRFG